MKTSAAPELKTKSSRFLESIIERLSNNFRVRRELPFNGRLHIDRQLPFLCVYRIPQNRNDTGTRQLVIGEASYLIAPADKSNAASLSNLVLKIVETLSPKFGAFIIIEIWSSDEIINPNSDNSIDTKPHFRIFTTENETGSLSSTIETLEHGLNKIRVLKNIPHVEIQYGEKVSPPGLPSLIPRNKAKELGCRTIGLQIKPIYQIDNTKEIYPLMLQGIKKGISKTLKQTFFEFTQKLTTQSPPHYNSLGRRAVVKAVFTIDRQLATVNNAFDFLLQVTPVNSEQEWAKFKKNRFRVDPTFRYRPRSTNPDLLMRTLYNIKIEKIEDPTLSQLFKEKREELDKQISMIRDRGSKRFLYESLILYGGVKPELLKFAELILDHIPSRSREQSGRKKIECNEFAQLASDEINYYRNLNPQFSARVEIRDDIPSGLMVSNGNLLIGKSTAIPHSRAEALLQHEIGTHIVTYFNGLSQPFQQLQVGLAGYEELQEGLAVLAEYLVGGLSKPRLRLLAGRVVAVNSMIEGATFIETFRLLDRNYDFEQRTAFVITVRVYRGGGLTKDAAYLRGLKGIVDYIKSGGDLEPLFIGKISAKDVPVIEELLYRKVLIPVPMVPRYMNDPKSKERIESLRGGLSLLNLIKGGTK